MFCWWNKSHIRQCLITHRKHVKRRMVDSFVAKRQFSSGKFFKLGDLYARLGLKGDASQSDIKKAYYKMSKEHHPDKNEGCTVSTAKFRSVTEAYEILGNVTTRTEYDRETPYARAAKRSRYKTQRPQPNSAFSEKDEDLAEKIRTYRENIRQRSRKPSDDEEFAFQRERVFDFDAWYRAHFHDDFDTKLRDERKIKYAKMYQEQMERMARGYRIRPPLPYIQRRQRSDIDIQITEMQRKEIRDSIRDIFSMGLIFTIALFVVLAIVDNPHDKPFGPYIDPLKKADPPSKPEEK